MFRRVHIAAKGISTRGQYCIVLYCIVLNYIVLYLAYNPGLMDRLASLNRLGTLAYFLDLLDTEML